MTEAVSLQNRNVLRFTKTGGRLLLLEAETKIAGEAVTAPGESHLNVIPALFRPIAGIWGISSVRDPFTSNVKSDLLSECFLDR